MSEPSQRAKNEWEKVRAHLFGPKHLFRHTADDLAKYAECQAIIQAALDAERAEALRHAAAICREHTRTTTADAIEAEAAKLTEGGENPYAKISPETNEY